MRFHQFFILIMEMVYTLKSVEHVWIIQKSKNEGSVAINLSYIIGCV